MTHERHEDSLLSELGRRARTNWEDNTRRRLEDSDAAMPSRGDEDAQLAALVLDQLEDEDEDEDDAAPASNAATLTRLWAPMLAVAASALLFFAWQRDQPASSQLIPQYEEVSFDGGIRGTREEAAFADGEVPRFRDGALLRWRVAPAHAVESTIGVRVDASGPSKRCLALAEELRIEPSGAVEVMGPADVLLDLPPGTWTLTLLVGSSDVLASLENPCAVDDEGSRPAGVRAAAQRRVVIERPAP
ncbi:MAG: hypothetical protein ACRBN8_32820 [Nannocystales bacterium]